MRVPWETVLEGPAVELLNVICYAKDKAAFREEEIKKWQKRH